MDDNFMSKVFEDKPCAEFLLRIILNRDDLKVKEVHGQHDLNNIQGRSVRKWGNPSEMKHILSM